MEILRTAADVLMALALAALVADRWLRPRHPEVDDIAEWVKGVERNVAMLRGRLNRIAPPRLGTGMEEDTSPPEIVAPEGSQGPLSKQRSAILSTWRKRRGL